MNEYTAADQRADTAFLVGVAHGRESERERIAQAIETDDTGSWTPDHFARIARESR